MQSQKNTSNVQNDLLTILHKPILKIEEWFLTLRLFRQCIQKNSIQYQLSHLQACNKTVCDILTERPNMGYPILLGIHLATWSHILHNMILKEELLHILGKIRAREILFYAHLFKHQSKIHQAFIKPQPFKTMTILKSLINYAYLTPNHPDYNQWIMVKKHLSLTLPASVINTIYAFLFMPHNICSAYTKELVNLEPISHIHSITNPQQNFNIVNIKKHLHIGDECINHEDILTFLLSHQIYILIDIFTAIIPLPWEKIANLMLEINEADKDFFLGQLQTCAITQSQFLSLNSLATMTNHINPKPHQAKLQYWLDVCQEIHQKNIMLIARRQRQIDYVCNHPIGIANLEHLLIHFNQTIENPKEWLTSIYIDKYSIASKDIIITKQILFSFTKKEHVSHFLVERLFTPQVEINPQFQALQIACINKIKALVKTYHQSTDSTLAWLFGYQSSELAKQVDMSMAAFNHELDFTKVVRYLRHIIETQMCITNRNDHHLFSAITKIDLECETNPILTR